MDDIRFEERVSGLTDDRNELIKLMREVIRLDRLGYDIEDVLMVPEKSFSSGRNGVTVIMAKEQDRDCSGGYFDYDDFRNK